MCGAIPAGRVLRGTTAQKQSFPRAGESRARKENVSAKCAETRREPSEKFPDSARRRTVLERRFPEAAAPIPPVRLRTSATLPASRPAPGAEVRRGSSRVQPLLEFFEGQRGLW